MNNLKEYITEKFKISKNIDPEKSGLNIADMKQEILDNLLKVRSKQITITNIFDKPLYDNIHPPLKIDRIGRTIYDEEIIYWQNNIGRRTTNDLSKLFTNEQIEKIYEYIMKLPKIS